MNLHAKFDILKSHKDKIWIFYVNCFLLHLSLSLCSAIQLLLLWMLEWTIRFPGWIAILEIHLDVVK